MASDNGDTTDAEYEIRRRRRRLPRDSSMWVHFVDLGGGSARCRHCNKALSFKTSITNLKKHLCGKHPEVVPPDSDLATKVYLFTNPKPNRNVPPHLRRHRRKRRKYLTYSEDHETSLNETHDSVDNSVRFSSEISNYFEEEDDELKCQQCKEVVSNNLEDMKSHLEEHHSDILDEIISKLQKIHDENSDGDNALEDDNNYTEILYLEDEAGNKLDYLPQNRTIQRSQYEPVTRRVKTERQSSPTPERVSKTKDSVEDESDVFLKYVGFLLKKVPKEATEQLHLDIINMIMNTRMKNHPQHKIIIESVAGNSELQTDNASALEREMFLLQNGSSTSQINTSPN